MKTLSIVITTKDRPAELKALLDSFTDTMYVGDFEVIVVDDNSADDAQFQNMQSVSDFHARTGLGKFVYMPSWSGPGGARNAGIEAATGDFVWCADGDDLIHWKAIPAIIDELHLNPRVPMLMLDYKVEQTGEPGNTITFGGSRLLPWQCGVMTWHKVIRRDLYANFVPRVFSEDIDWWMSMCLNPEIDRFQAPGILAYTYRRFAEGSITKTGADKSDGRNVRVIVALKRILADAVRTSRPHSFVSHIKWLIRQYEKGEV